MIRQFQKITTYNFENFTKNHFPQIKFCEGKDTYVDMNHCDCIEKCRLVPITNIKEIIKLLKKN